MRDMTQEQKDLLLKDLCSRLPYGVKVNNEIQGDFNIYGICENLVFGRNEVCHIDFNIENIKPYLFPLSSMTEEQKMELTMLRTYVSLNKNKEYLLFDWLNTYHFDYRGLIDKELSIDCTNLKIY